MTEKRHALHRLIVCVIMASVHTVQVLQVGVRMEKQLPMHPELNKYLTLAPRYLTLWNITFQLAYMFLAVLCDVTTLIKMESLVGERIRSLRHSLFSGLIFPYALGITITFWPIFFYDRELIFPEPSDLIISKFENFSSHFLITIFAIWELVFSPRNSEKKEKGSIAYLVVISILYLVVTFYTRYGDMGYWCYEFIALGEGSIMVFVIACGPVLLMWYIYMAQRHIKAAIWRVRDGTTKEE